MEISVFFTYLFLFFALYVEVFLLIGFLSKGGIKVINESRTPEPVAPADLPRVAIFVPSYNEEKTVAQTITSLLSLDYPHDKLEIIVIDDGSKDRGLSRKSFAKTQRRKTQRDEPGTRAYRCRDRGLPRRGFVCRKGCTFVVGARI